MMNLPHGRTFNQDSPSLQPGRSESGRLKRQKQKGELRLNHLDPFLFFTTRQLDNVP